jgi:hypothetical protein
MDADVQAQDRAERPRVRQGRAGPGLDRSPAVGADGRPDQDRVPHASDDDRRVADENEGATDAAVAVGLPQVHDHRPGKQAEQRHVNGSATLRATTSIAAPGAPAPAPVFMAASVARRP